jgi:hypothetical protein
LHRTINPSMANDQLKAGVDEAILYLQNIPADDPVQSVLLTPIFIVGCSTFDHQQRPAIIEAIEALENYSHLGNIKPTRQVIEEVWKLMDEGDSTSWDWEAVMKRMVSMAMSAQAEFKTDKSPPTGLRFPRHIAPAGHFLRPPNGSFPCGRTLRTSISFVYVSLAIRAGVHGQFQFLTSMRSRVYGIRHFLQRASHEAAYQSRQAVF